MKLGIMQPYIFPYIGYFQLINVVDKFVILDDVNFINRGWINRNKLLVNGKEQLFTIPLQDASQNKLIKDIEIISDNRWKDKLLKTIQFNYNKAPHYKSVYPFIESIVRYEEQNISKYIAHSLLEINQFLYINTEMVLTSSVYKKHDEKGSDRILNICLAEKASTYINPVGGTELYDKNEFKENRIDLFFIQSLPVKYKQLNNEFVPWLSVLDIMMFNSVEEINLMLNNFKLI